jgi:hypothetical protein
MRLEDPLQSRQSKSTLAFAASQPELGQIIKSAMKFSCTSITLLLTTMLWAGSQALAAEARPWLCRDKPVFSSDKPMTYKAINHSGGRWLMTFMRFDPSGLGHDGFTVSSSQDVATDAEGTLDPGQWYAVALYRAGGHWICPGNARENDEPSPGVVSNLCYGEDPGECAVNLTVRPQSTGGSHQ